MNPDKLELLLKLSHHLQECYNNIANYNIHHLQESLSLEATLDEKDEVGVLADIISFSCWFFFFVDRAKDRQKANKCTSCHNTEPNKSFNNTQS